MLNTQAQEENITRYLMDIFWEIIRGNRKAEEITRLFLPVFERKRAV
jgi:hypothetical protein